MTKFHCAFCGGRGLELGDTYYDDGSNRFCNVECAGEYFEKCVVDTDRDDYIAELWAGQVELDDLSDDDPHVIAHMDVCAANMRYLTAEYWRGRL